MKIFLLGMACVCWDGSRSSRPLGGHQLLVGVRHNHGLRIDEAEEQDVGRLRHVVVHLGLPGGIALESLPGVVGQDYVEAHHFLGETLDVLTGTCSSRGGPCI